MLWAQVMPFVALWLWEGGDADAADDDNQVLKDTIRTTLIGSFSLWFVLNAIFFCTIDMSFVKTFFGTMTASQYTCECFTTSTKDHQKFDAAFDNLIDFTTAIHGEVKAWVAANIEGWKATQPEWFKIEKIPDEFLSPLVLAEEGGAKRRRSSVSMFEHVKESVKLSRRQIDASATIEITRARPLLNDREERVKFAKVIYAIKTNNHKNNYQKVKNLFEENKEVSKRPLPSPSPRHSPPSPPLAPRPPQRQVQEILHNPLRSPRGPLQLPSPSRRPLHRHGRLER